LPSQKSLACGTAWRGGRQGRLCGRASFFEATYRRCEFNKPKPRLPMSLSVLTELAGAVKQLYTPIFVPEIFLR